MLNYTEIMTNLPFYSPEYAREVVSPLETTYGERLLDLLVDPIVTEEIDSGNVTLAMVRPGLMDETTLDGPDGEVAFALESAIERLGILAKFSVCFDQEALDEFYSGGPREIQIEKPAERLGHKNRWDEFSGIIVGNPTTVLLLHSDTGDAIDKWRDQVGFWNIEDEEKKNPNTIRGRFGVSNYNNLVHGSDSPDAVKREADILLRLMLRSQK